MPIPASALAVWRNRWADRMVEAADVTTIGVRGTFNESTLVYDSPDPDEVLEGVACLFRPMSTETARIEFGGATRSVVGMFVFLPWTTTGIEVGAKVVKLAAPATGDPTLVGVPMYVVGWQYDAYKTRLRLACRIDEGTRDNADSG